MVDPTALAYMRHWIIDKTEDSKRKLHTWQMGVTFAGMFISAVIAMILFSISKPLAISTLVLFGLSLIIPLLFRSVPFSNDHLIVAETTKRYENAIVDILSEMNTGITSVSFPESVLDADVKLQVTMRGGSSEISMRDVNGEMKFYRQNEEIVPVPHVHGPYDALEFCPMCVAIAA